MKAFGALGKSKSKIGGSLIQAKNEFLDWIIFEDISEKSSPAIGR